MANSAAAIVGIGSTPIYFRGESWPQTMPELIGKAVIAAVADAGLTIDDVDGLAFFAFGFDTGLLIETLGLKNVTFANCVSSFGSGLAGMLDLAAMAVETGRAKHVVCIGGTQQIGRRLGYAIGNFAATPDNIFHRIAGLNGPGQALALQARRHMHLYGTRREAFGEVVMSSRANASTRERSFRRKPLTLDEYMASPMLADPPCRLDFCLETDGALAFVVFTLLPVPGLPDSGPDKAAPPQWRMPTLVEFDDAPGVRLVSVMVEAPVGGVAIGDAVEIVWRPAANARVPVFRQKT